MDATVIFWTCSNAIIVGCPPGVIQSTGVICARYGARAYIRIAIRYLKTAYLDFYYGQRPEVARSPWKATFFLCKVFHCPFARCVSSTLPYNKQISSVLSILAALCCFILTVMVQHDVHRWCGRMACSPFLHLFGGEPKHTLSNLHQHAYLVIFIRTSLTLADASTVIR